MDNSWLFAVFGNPLFIKFIQITVFLLMLTVALRLPLTRQSPLLQPQSIGLHIASSECTGTDRTAGITPSIKALRLACPSSNNTDYFGCITWCPLAHRQGHESGRKFSLRR